MPSMDALNFFKLWKLPSSPATIPPPEYEDDDSFFDLNLNAPRYDRKLLEINSDDSDEEYELLETKSPISFFRSPRRIPSFFMFRKKNAGDESPNAIGRVNSSRKKKSIKAKDETTAKDVVSKYLRLMKAKVSRSSFDGEVSPESPSRELAGEKQGMRSPSMRIVCRKLGKSRSALPAGASPSVGSAGGDAVVQSDGIQSAILHCKRSYNSPIDLSVLSRSVSEPVISVNPSRFSIEENKRISI